MNLAGIFLARVFGLPRDTAYRLSSLLLFAVMLPFFFAFVRARFGTMEAIVSTLLVVYFPVVVDQSVEPMPEQGAATAFVAGLYFFVRHVDEGRSRHLIAATVCFALMLLSSPRSYCSCSFRRDSCCVVAGARVSFSASVTCWQACPVSCPSRCGSLTLQRSTVRPS